MSSLTGCTGKTSTNSNVETMQTATGNTTISLLDTSDLFTERDYETEYDEEECIQITLDNENTVCEADGVFVDGQIVTISKEGTYLLSGTLTNGSIVINAEKTEKIHLIFDNVSITNENGAGIEIQQAKKVFLTLKESSENKIVSNFNESDTESKVDAAIFSKDDLTLNGTGSLTITSEKHGIVSKDDLVVTGGNYSISAQKQGISGKDSVRIADGSFEISSGTDAIHSEYASDEETNADALTEDSESRSASEEKGFVYIAGGSFTFDAQGDGISSSYVTQLDGGTYDIVTGGGSANAQEKTEEMPGKEGKRGQSPDGTGVPDGMNASETEQTEETEDTTSTKGIKSGTAILINDGTFTVDSCDDAVHSNGDVTINGGDFTISTGDDGVHADDVCTINNGSIQIEKSYEGIEGHQIYLAGGEIHVVSSDDGLNAAGDTTNTETQDDAMDTSETSELAGKGQNAPGQGGPGGMGGMDEVDEEAEITISSGELTIDATGDGIDSNGDLHVIGGTIYVTGPSNDGNGALDYAGSADITGGTIVAVGMSGMAQNFGEDSTQGTMLINQDSTQSGEVSLTDSEGNVLVSFTPVREYNSIVISSAGLEEGGTYTLTTGSESSEITMSSLVYSEGQSQNGPGQGGQNRPDGQGRPGGQGVPGQEDVQK